MNKILLTIIATFILSLSVSAQSGSALLKGFVASGIKNGSAIDATVELRAIESNSKTKSVDTVQTKYGYYEFEVSFGYYLLTISAKGYETYQTKVYIPSSSTLNWGTILEKSKPKGDKCVSGNCDNGKGKLIYADGNIYEGDFVKGKKEGQGRFTVTETGQVYIGQFANERYNGRGKMTFSDGESYEGDWVYDQKTGKGKTVYSNGDIYEGDFVDSKKDGRGTYTFKNGNYYTGEWKNNLKNGYGKEYTKATATTREGIWKNDVFVGAIK